MNFTQHPIRTLLVLAGIPLLVVLAVLGYFWWNFGNVAVSNSVEHWGQTGDFVGGILNPILAFASLLVVCYTLWVHIQNANVTARTGTIQTVENLIFELLRLHRNNLQSIDLYDSETKRTTVGSDCFIAFLNWVRTNHDRNPPTTPTENSLRDAYEEFYEQRKRKSEVGHYFRNLYHIFKFISEHPVLTDDEKIHYTKIVRAQLSMPETAMLFYNGLHSAGERFKPHIKKYALLQELEAGDLGINGLTQEIMFAIYGRESFADS